MMLADIQLTDIQLTMSPARSILCCTLLAMLGACASAEWVSNAGQIADAPVLAQCSQQAWARVRREQMANAASAPVPLDTSGRVSTLDSAHLPQSDVQEQTYFNLCMKEKGYELVPIKPGAGR